MINAGRGNPNWVATVPREVFFQLGLFALEESKQRFTDLDGFGGVAIKKGIADRFSQYAQSRQDDEGVSFLSRAIEFSCQNYDIVADDLVEEWVDGILGDNYPMPDRMLVQAEKIVHAYLIQEMAAGEIAPPPGHFDLFAVEGGTAAMVYIFNSLRSNRLINAGDTIALGVPIFTPYIEIPELEDYNLQTIEVIADENASWQVPDAELEKLYDPKVKAFFLVNPSNPPSVKLSDASLQKIADIAKARPDLILLTDDVYGTFTDGFTSLAMIAPENTILVYSFSKYFGATGWRLGVIALHENNILDKAIAKLPDDVKQQLSQRYHDISLDPADIKMIDRMVADSRAVALNHTAGLSTPQQIQMTLFSLLSLMDKENKYKQTAQEIVRRRYATLLKEHPIPPLVSLDDPHGAFYYIEIDILRLARLQHGDDFSVWLAANYEPLDIVIRLAQEKEVIAMPGGGFDAPKWSLRLSLANLFAEDYVRIAKSEKEIMADYYASYLQEKSEG